MAHPFKHGSAAHPDLIERILLELADERRAAYQDFQAEEALELIAWLHLAGHRYTRYSRAAHRLGSNHWQSIEALAESALAAGRHDVAVDVFRAADQPGMHRDHLRRRCLALTGVQLDDGAPRLRVVDDTARSEQGW